MTLSIVPLLTFCSHLIIAYGMPAASPSHAPHAHCEKSQVLILGAGMAGISAGAALSRAGVTDFKIIEHQDRIGGRTLSSDFGIRGANDSSSSSSSSSWKVELGTNWIVGLQTANGSSPEQGKVNPIWTLAQEVNLSTVGTDGPTELYGPNGAQDWSAALRKYTAAAARAAKLSKKCVGSGESDISAQEALELVGWDAREDIYAQAAERLLGESNAAVPADLSSAHYGTFEADTGGETELGPYSRFVVDQRGYDVVTRHLAGKYLSSVDDSRLVLNAAVTEIDYADDGAVVVRTADDSCYVADHAICTFSLSVLQQALDGAEEKKKKKAAAAVQFTPEFPPWKAEAIRGNVMGLYTKIFYQFAPEEVFWPKEVRMFLYASPTRKGWWPIWISLDFPGSPLEGSGIIFATMIWDESRQIEQQSDEETMQQGLEVLRQMFPDVTVPQKPQAFLYPRWGTTPWAYGSYPAWKTGYTRDEQRDLKARLGSLWFAGDATSEEYWGYLHGAYFEGQRAGEEVAACVQHGGCEEGRGPREHAREGSDVNLGVQEALAAPV